MPKSMPRNVQVERNRHGRTAYYFRLGHGGRIRLPDSVGSIEFQRAVQMARESGAVNYKRPAKRPDFLETRIRQVGNALERAIRSAKTRAVKKRVPFDLTIEWALDLARMQALRCSLTGIPFYMECGATSKVHPFMPSLDRIDPKLGYVRKNVRLVVYAVNVMLMDWGLDVFARVANGYRHTKGTKTRTLFSHLVIHSPAPEKLHRKFKCLKA